MSYIIKETINFKKDFKRIVKRNYDISLLKDVILMLKNKQPLDEKYKDHVLIGNYKGYRECHLKPDWLLIYKIVEEDNFLIPTRTGSHSDLFS